MDVDRPHIDSRERPSASDGVDKSGYDPLAGPGPGAMPPMRMGPPGMMPPSLPPIMPPFGPLMFPGPHPMPPLKKKKWADAPKEFPTEGEGFPFPQGGWAYGQSVGKPYDYQKLDSYRDKIQEAEKRTIMQLAFVYLLDMQPTTERFLSELKEQQILVLHSDDPLDVADSLICRLFTVNNIKHNAVPLSQLLQQPLKSKETCIVLSDTLEASSCDGDVIEAIKDFVSKGGLLLSYNASLPFLSSVFPKKIKPRLGFSTIDKPIEIACNLHDSNKDDDDSNDSRAFQQYASYANAQQQVVRLMGIQRFEVIDSTNSVSTLITETAPQVGQPLAVKFKFGKGKSRGTVYHSITTHLVAKIGSQGGTSFQPLADMLPHQSKPLAESCIDNLAKAHPSAHATIAAWKTALKCGYPNCINIAQSYYPFLDSLFSIIMHYFK